MARDQNEGRPFETDDLVYYEAPTSEADCSSTEPVSISDKLLSALLAEKYSGGTVALRKKIQTTHSWSRLAAVDYSYQPRPPAGAGDLIAEFFQRHASPGSYRTGLALAMRRKRLLLLVMLFHKVNRRLPAQAELIDLDHSYSPL